MFAKIQILLIILGYNHRKYIIAVYCKNPQRNCLKLLELPFSVRKKAVLSKEN